MEELKEQLISIGFSEELASIMSDSVTDIDSSAIVGVDNHAKYDSYPISDTYYCDNIIFSSHTDEH